MLPWLPSAWPKQQRLFWRIWCIILAVHVSVLAVCLFYSRPKPLVIHISRNIYARSYVVKVLPFVRSTGQLSRVFTHVCQGKRSARARLNARHVRHAHVITRVEKVQKNKVQKNNVSLRVKAKKTKSKHEVFQAPKLEVKKLLAHKVRDKTKEPQKVAAEDSRVLVHEKPQEPVAQKVEQAQEIKQEVAELPVPPVLQSPGVPEDTHDTLEPLDVSLASDNSQEEEPVVIGQEEYEQLQAYQAIYTQMSTQWHPPAGIKPPRACIILITVNNKGLVEQFNVEQSSGVLAYDIAARMAISRVQFPRYIWSQQVRLHF